MGQSDYLVDDLGAHWRTLQSQWVACRDQWQDAVSDRFEREYWTLWQKESPRMIEALSELDAVLDQALRRTE